MPSLVPGLPCVAAMGEKQPLLTSRADIGALDRVHPGLRQLQTRDLGQIEHRTSEDPLSKSCKRPLHLFANLIAAATDPRTDGGTPGIHRLDSAGKDAGVQPAPTTVQHRGSARAPEGDRQTIGDEDKKWHPRY